MLLSLFVSFLLTRKLRGKTRVLPVIASLVLISFFSVGTPNYHELPMENQRGILFDNPLSISFPFYASLTIENVGISTGTQYYQLYFLTLMLHKDWVQATSPGVIWLNMSWSDYILYYSFFMLVNMVGTIIGYWLSKAAFIDKLLTR